MNFLNLKYFMVVAQEMSFTKAAEKLYLSQQSLSGHIRRLEAECGTPLFERNPKLKLTYAGTCVLRHAAKILDLESQMTMQLSDIANLRSGHLSIGTSHTRGRIILPMVLPAYIQRYPTIELITHNGLSDELEGLLLEGELDLMIAFPPFKSAIIETVPVMKERLCLVVPANIMEMAFPNVKAADSYFKQNGADISAFAELPFIMIKRGRIRNMINRYLEENDISPRIVMEHADLETLLELATRGAGVAFCFESFARHPMFSVEDKNRRRPYIFPLRDPKLTSTLAIAFHKERYLSKAAKDFISLTQEVFKDSMYL
ncbi:MAG: LysR family transcriptional regulator [Oscillospiraceae bacterium]|nr:LysR family transcriptional regulator [Oscillospiraceae bacterium]MBQ4539097.1 LysR family transcriptional regulator [Oscillospiraceae bacterium]